jgi:hypothetical protein
VSSLILATLWGVLQATAFFAGRKPYRPFPMDMIPREGWGMSPWMVWKLPLITVTMLTMGYWRRFPTLIPSKDGIRGKKRGICSLK